MYKVYNNDYPLFQAMFVLNKNLHNHNTRQVDHNHIPLFKQDLVKQGCVIMEHLYGIEY